MCCPYKKLNQEDPTHQSYGVSFSLSVDGPAQGLDHCNGFEITYYPVD